MGKCCLFRGDLQHAGAENTASTIVHRLHLHLDPPQVRRQAEYVYNVGQGIIKFQSTPWKKTEMLPAFSTVEWLKNYPKHVKHWDRNDLRDVIKNGWKKVEKNMLKNKFQI